jgi:hypothetical protein
MHAVSVWRRFLGAIAALGVLFASSLARADPSLVVLLGRPSDTTEAPPEILNRVREELLADGFEVESVGPAQGADRARVVREASRGAEASISAALFLDDDGAIDMILLDTQSGRMGERRIEGPALGDGPEVFARHAVALLRASLLDFALGGLRSANTKPRARTLPAEAPKPTGWALEGGAGVIAGFAGVGLSAAPVLGLRRAASRMLQLRLTGAGMGSSPTIQTNQGQASVAQGLLLVDGTAVLAQSRWIRPLLTLGAGAYYVGATGTPVPPYQGLSGHTLALALDAGVGLATSLTQSVDLTLEAHVILAEPGIAVRAINEDVAHVGQPALLMTLTLADWL